MEIHPSNSGQLQPTASHRVYPCPCAVIADAVNILSNSWVDSNSSASLSSRVASNTTVNAAIVSGIVPSANNYYSGGAENFPRFLETWSGKVSHLLWLNGGALSKSPVHQSLGSANVYNPPNRQWFFDTNFQINYSAWDLDCIQLHQRPLVSGSMKLATRSTYLDELPGDGRDGGTRIFLPSRRSLILDGTKISQLAFGNGQLPRVSYQPPRD